MLNAPPRDDLKEIIAAHCKASFPKEACGFVVSRRGGKEMEVVSCFNASATPLEAFRIRPEDFQAVEDNGGEIELVWHSHPNGKAEASPADMTCAETFKIAYLIYATPADLWTFYAPVGWKADLVGRPFVHGVLDCYTLCRDYYASIGIALPDYYREDFWWEPVKELDNGQVMRSPKQGRIVSPPLDLYMKNFEDAGFVRVAKLAKDDAILMRLQHHVVNHAGIYMGDAMMLHHPPKGISSKIPFRVDGSSFYVRASEVFLRHQSLLGRYPES